MKLRAKFNLVLLAVFVLGLLATGFVSYTLLHVWRGTRNDAGKRVLSGALPGSGVR